MSYLHIPEQHLRMVINLMLLKVIRDIAQQRHFGNREQIRQLNHLLCGDSLQRSLVTSRVILQCTTALHIAPTHRPVLVNVQHLCIAQLTTSSVHSSQLDLQETVQLEQESLLHVIVQSSNGKAVVVWNLLDLIRVLEVQFKNSVCIHSVVKISRTINLNWNAN